MSKPKSQPAASKTKAPSAAAAGLAAAAAEALKTAGAADAPQAGENPPPADPAAGSSADPAASNAADGDGAPGAPDGAGAPGDPEQPPVIVALLVTSKREGFRRAGRPWSCAQTRVDLSELTDSQVEALWADPMLDVVGVAE